MTALSPSPRTVRTPAPGRPTHALLGSVLVVVGFVLLLSEAGVFVSPWPAVPALLLVFVGGAITVEGLRGVWHGALVGLAIVLAVITAASTTAANSWHVTTGGVGDRAYAPRDVTELEEHYELGAGTFELDLRRLSLPEGTTSLAINVGVGEIEVRVPEDVAVDVTADSGTGEIDVFGESRGGLGVDQNFVSPGYGEAGRRLDLDLSVGMGRIEVTR